MNTNELHPPLFNAQLFCENPRGKRRINRVLLFEKLDEFKELQRARLLQLRDRLIDTIAGVTKMGLRERDDLVANCFRDDPSDAGSDSFDCSLALSFLAQDRSALVEIDAALARIDKGTYGICEDCGLSIPRARLEALPFTRRTVDCQERLERAERLSRLSRISQQTLRQFDAGGRVEEFEEEKEESLNTERRFRSAPSHNLRRKPC